MNSSLRSINTVPTSNSSSRGSSRSSFPNWRTLSGDEGEGESESEGDAEGEPEDITNVSHFAHIQPNNNESNESSSPQTQSAPWSSQAYKSALTQYDTFINGEDSYIQPFVQDALHTLDHAYRLYGPESVIGSFNGGKDAVVILELMRAAHANYYRNLNANANANGDLDLEDSKPTRPRVIYFNNALEFPQVYDFVRHAVEEYDLDMLAFQEGVGFVGGLEILVKQNYLHPILEGQGQQGQAQALSAKTRTRSPMPHPMAFVLGTRAADPNAGNQGTFAPSSTYMPPFMRVNPILEWSYGHIWHFLRLYKLPYCSLYDEGYTSLGTVKDTLPCPALKKVHVEGDGAADYWPAYMLKDWEQERAGRVKKEKKKRDTDASKSDKIAQREVDAISRCSTVASLPKNEAPPALRGEVVQPTKAIERAATSTSTTSNLDDDDNDDSDDVSSIGSNSTISLRTVGIIVIGDEILKGLTPDTNTHAAALALNANNVPLARVVVVSDNQDEIIAEIKKMNETVDVIITSGGIGPTHDDVTIKAVAVALGSEMVLNQDMAALLRSKMNGDAVDGAEQELTEAQVKMATLPDCSMLKYLSGIEGDWPVLQCRNIFILPGVPQFFEKKVKHVASYLSRELERSVAFKVVLSIDENSIVPILNNVVLNHPNVSFGSYPFVNHPEFKTVVTLEGRRIGYEKDEIDVHVKVALSDLVNGLPDDSVLRVDNNNDLTFL